MLLGSLFRLENEESPDFSRLDYHGRLSLTLQLIDNAARIP